MVGGTPEMAREVMPEYPVNMESERDSMIDPIPYVVMTHFCRSTVAPVLSPGVMAVTAGSFIAFWNNAFRATQSAKCSQSDTLLQGVPWSTFFRRGARSTKT